MRRLSRVLIALTALAVLVGATVTLVRNSNGDFSGAYKLSGDFAKAGEGLPPGSEVVFRGVQIGRVSTIALQGDMARVSVWIDPTFKVPIDTTATIQPINLFGAEEISLTTPNHNSDAGPYLAPGGFFAHADNTNELGDLFAAAVPLLNKIDTTNLSTVLAELAQASQGEGPRIAKSIDTGTQLAGLLNATLNAQLISLASFARFTQAVAPDTASLNNLNAEVNAALPAFNNEEADYQKLLAALVPFANHLTSLLITYRPDIDTILTSGDNISRVLLAQQNELGQVVQGAYTYFHTIAAGGASQTKLPDGSTYAYFNTFILFSQVNALVCSLLAPAPVSLATVLTSAGSAFNCTAQTAALRQAQALPAAPAGSTSSSTAAAQSAAAAAQSASTQLYGIAGVPDISKGSGLGGFINGLLGKSP
ncbi:MAG TPA: MCE family protein [Acidimicrobiales bacterium]|nr:MCE family protein [Acidimicrobiales bacterium]